MFSDWSARLAPVPPGAYAAAAAFAPDGRPAVFVAAARGPSRLLRWRNGRLVDVAPPMLADPARPAAAVAAADCDGDGREELYVIGGDGRPDRLLALTPAGWVDRLADARGRGGSRAAAALDRRGTGRYGFAVVGPGGPTRLIELGAAGRPHDAAPELGLDPVADARGVWAGPLVTDRVDLLVTADGVPARLFAHAGDGRFAEAAGRFKLAEAGRAVAVLDADGDGRPDVALGDWHDPNRLLVRQMDGTFRNRASPAFGLPGAVRAVVAADFDNCGHEELFLHLHGEPNRLFRQVEGGWRLCDPGPATLADAPGTGACVADLDGDGTLELLLCHGEVDARPLGLFKAANTNGWLRVQPLTRFGAPARGAVVRLTTGGRGQVRVIDGGGHEPVAHFGLGPLDRADAIAVTWPDGARADLGPLTGRQALTVRHPDT